MSNFVNGIRMGQGMLRFLSAVLLVLACGPVSAQSQDHRVRNIVLVHGAWADGSGWKDVYDILVKDGFHVSIVQEPETSFKEDVAATKRVLAQQDGPCILVAHSYGGAVITEAGTDPSVAGLVYVAAHMPDAGENEADDGKRFPSDLSKSTAIKKTADGFTYLDPAQFHEYFAADLSAEQAAFMAQSQVLNAADNFKAVITTAAWRKKPSWMLVAGADRTINPDLERWYATRAGSHKAEVSGASHSVYVSRPKEVAALIKEAASQARERSVKKIGRRAIGKQSVNLMGGLQNIDRSIICGTTATIGRRDEGEPDAGPLPFPQESLRSGGRHDASQKEK